MLWKGLSFVLFLVACSATFAGVQTTTTLAKAGPSSDLKGERPAVEWGIDHVWLDAAGTALPFQSDEEILEFLRRAEPVSYKVVGEGINGTYKVLLDYQGVRAHGAFRYVRSEKKKAYDSEGRLAFNFRDDCEFEVAAFRLSRLLGLDNVPPAVKRNLYGKRGTLQIWVEDAVMEKQRAEKHLSAPNGVKRVYQLHAVRLFDSLIYNDDRNQGNILYGPNWKVWMIDHTRTFRWVDTPKDLDAVIYCDRRLFENLRSVSDDEIREAVGEVLRESEIKTLLKRRGKLVAHIERLIESRGEERVLI